MVNNAFKNIKNKLASCFMKKEEKKLLAIGRSENLCSKIFFVVLGIMSAFAFGTVLPSLIILLLELKIDHQLFFKASMIWDIPLFVGIYFYLRKKDLRNFNPLKIIRKQDHEKLMPMLELYIKNPKEWPSIVNLLYQTKVEAEVLNLFNKDVAQKISKNELDAVLEDIELANIMNKTGGVTYGYLFKLLEKIEDLEKTKDDIEKAKNEIKKINAIIDLQKEIFTLKNSDEKNQTLINEDERRCIELE